ncbi:MAG: SMP-30/gluconolactonase/LRE family protein [bacterium]
MKITKTFFTTASVFLIVFSISFFAFSKDTNAVIQILFDDQLEKTEGIALCPNGRLFVAENASGKIYEIVDDETLKLFSEGFNHPAGMACDSGNRLYLVEFPAGNLKRISEDGSKSETIASGLKQPNGVAAAADGTIYVSESEAGRVTVIAPDGEKEILAEKIPYANGVLLANGDTLLFVNSSLGNKTVVISTAGDDKGKKKTFASPLLAPDGITADNAGNFYVCVYGKGEIARIDEKGKVEIISSGLKGPASPAFKNGALYVTSVNGKGIYKITQPPTLQKH